MPSMSSMLCVGFFSYKHLVGYSRVTDVIIFFFFIDFLGVFHVAFSPTCADQS